MFEVEGPRSRYSTDLSLPSLGLSPPATMIPFLPPTVVRAHPWFLRLVCSRGPVPQVPVEVSSTCTWSWK